VLVVKDGMSGFVELIACVSATSDEVYHGLMDWFKRFGVVPQWVSDRGAHFLKCTSIKITRSSRNYNELRVPTIILQRRIRRGLTAQ
jgi:hypothetical protein